ncbi:MAG: hypothetical protein SVU88_01295 [Candidatus Nanohaloarchaea archaeon]|nr:hypothetical protein [Candidatus Nanohaloarchaea archaeon]
MPVDIAAATVLARFQALLLFPAEHPDFLPSLIPIFLGLVVIELYFGRYEREPLGWNSAVSNAVLLIATALTLIIRLNLLQAASGPRYIVAYSILVLGTVILLLNFYHVWPASIAFSVSSGFVVYTLVYIAIAWVYEELPLDADTTAAAVLVFTGFWVFFTALQHLERSVVPERLRARQR